MKAQCPHCKAEMTIPDDYTGNEIKCLKCNKQFTPKQHKAKYQRGMFVTIAIGIMIILGLVLAMYIRASSKADKLESKIVQMERQNKQLIAQIAKFQKQDSQELKQLKSEARRKQSEARRKRREAQRKQGEQQTEKAYMISCKEWRGLGFPKFCNIPAKGKVPEVYPKSVGDYGKARSVTIIQVLGPYGMLVELGNKQLIRLKGYTTKGLVDGKWWTGQNWLGNLSKVVHDTKGKVQFITPEIAIIGTWTYTTAMGSQRTVFTAIPLDFIREGLTRAQFQELLE